MRWTRRAARWLAVVLVCLAAVGCGIMRNTDETGSADPNPPLASQEPQE